MKDEFKQAMIKARLTNKYLLIKTEELIKAIKDGSFKPRNREKKLAELEDMKEITLNRIRNGEE